VISLYDEDSLMREVEKEKSRVDKYLNVFERSAQKDEFRRARILASVEKREKTEKNFQKYLKGITKDRQEYFEETRKKQTDRQERLEK